MPTYDAFLCYNSREEIAVDQIASILKNQGIKVWLAKWDALGGDDWRQEVEEAIAVSSTGIVFIGASGIGSGMKEEFEALNQPNIRKIPVLLPDAPKDIVLPMYLKRYVSVDLRGLELNADTLSRLIRSINRKVPVSASGSSSTDRPAGAESQADALRAYLQRCEVRLSTMHRIAGSFLGGAGLLLLLPLFFKDALTTTLRLYPLTDLDKPQDTYQLIAVAIMLLVPLFAMYLLVKELSQFYFSANIPEGDETEVTKDSPFHPKFALTAIPFPDDEGNGIKARMRRLQSRGTFLNFVIPHSPTETEWLERLRPQVPKDEDFLSLKVEPWFKGITQSKDVMNLRMAFGLAGAHDRTLMAEAAKSELSLVRHNLLLRRLVLRYVKAFILFLWTALVLFTASAWIGAKIPAVSAVALQGKVRVVLGEADKENPKTAQDLRKPARSEDSIHDVFHKSEENVPATAAVAEKTKTPTSRDEPDAVRSGKTALGAALLIWAICVPKFIRAPIRWIHAEFTKDVKPITKSDPHLVKFERSVCSASLVICILGLASSILGHFWLVPLALLGISMNTFALLLTFEKTAKSVPEWFH